MAAVTVSPDRKLLRAAVRSEPGGWVRVVELADGWVVFPDVRGTLRRWQWFFGIGIFVMGGLEWLPRHGFGPDYLQAVFAFGAIGCLIVLVSLGQASDTRAGRERRRIRRESVLLAGGMGAQKQAFAHMGRARTVAEMNVLLSSLGRAEGVYSARRIRGAEIRRRWWGTVVDLDFGKGHVVYRSLSVRAAGKLARIFRNMADQRGPLTKSAEGREE
jgi:hypothetical protein